MIKENKKAKIMDFGAEIAKIMPIIIREAAKMQLGVITKGVLTVPQIATLELLAEKGPARMGELASVLHLTMPAVTAIVDKMIKLKLVRRERSDKDRRIVKVILLERGSQTARRINEERRDATNGLFSALGAEEKAQYLKLLSKVCCDLRKRR